MINKLPLVVASASLVVSLAANVTLAVRQAENKTTTARINSALCTFRTDLRDRAVNTRLYLREHPDKFILGIPRTTLVENLHNQELTLESLSDLHC